MLKIAIKWSIGICVIIGIISIFYPFCYRKYITSQMLDRIQTKYIQQFEVVDESVWRYDIIMGQLPDRWTVR